MLKEIGKTNEVYALRLLQCLTVAKRPLYVDELAEILVLDFSAEEGIPELRKNWRWKDEQDAVLSTCSSLIVVVGGGHKPHVQFAHFSVQEFLTSDRLATSGPDISYFHILPEPAHTIISKACLGILLQSEMGIGGANVENSSLIGYAASHWVDHARFEKVWKCVEDGIRHLFDPEKPHLDAWLTYSRIQSSRFFVGYNLDKHHGSPLYYASLCGFHDLVLHLIFENPQCVPGQVGQNPTPLVAALSGGYLDIAELLYRAGADLGLRNSNHNTLLHAASAEGSMDVVKWLYSHSVFANSQQGRNQTLFHPEEANKRPWNIISINTGDTNNNTPLHLASKHGHFDIVRELLLQGADVGAQNHGHQMQRHLVSDFWVRPNLHHS